MTLPITETGLVCFHSASGIDEPIVMLIVGLLVTAAVGSTFAVVIWLLARALTSNTVTPAAVLVPVIAVPVAAQVADQPGAVNVCPLGSVKLTTQDVRGSQGVEEVRHEVGLP